MIEIRIQIDTTERGSFVARCPEMNTERSGFPLEKALSKLAEDLVDLAVRIALREPNDPRYKLAQGIAQLAHPRSFPFIHLHRVSTPEQEGPYFKGQEPVECGHYFPDVVRVGDRTHPIRGLIMRLNCIHCGNYDLEDPLAGIRVRDASPPATPPMNPEELIRFRETKRAELRNLHP